MIGRRYFLTRRRRVLQVQDDVRKCVCFLAYREGGQPRLAGTAFFLGDLQPNSIRGATVTARHVVDGIMGHSDDGKAHLILNENGKGLASVETEAADWLTHPDGQTVDVALLPWLPPVAQFDQLVYPVTETLNDLIINKENIGVGDEVFLTGLFVNHRGQDRNIPIVRVGNIAAMPEEPVETALGAMEAYLVEARSIGGISGSPVFVNLGTVRQTENQPAFTFGRSTVYLMGVTHGHWDAAPVMPGGETVNMGIAIVTPIAKVLEMMEKEDFTLMKEDSQRKTTLPTPDIRPPQTSRDDFLRDLRKAARRSEQKPSRSEREKR